MWQDFIRFVQSEVAGIESLDSASAISIVTYTSKPEFIYSKPSITDRQHIQVRTRSSDVLLNHYNTTRGLVKKCFVSAGLTMILDVISMITRITGAGIQGPGQHHQDRIYETGI